MGKNIKTLSPDSDPFGAALWDHQQGKRNLFIKVHSDASEEDHIHVKYLFRKYSSWPVLEKKAISLCKGKILELGGGAGSHSLYLQSKGQEVHCLDFSPGAIEVMKERGVENTVFDSVDSYSGTGFDTVLLLMNGIGLVKDIKGLHSFLSKCFSQFLKPGGQLLFDSSDLVYLLSDPGSTIHAYKNKRYYGEVFYRMEYEGIFGPKFKWLFIDFNTLKGIAKKEGLIAEKLFEDDHFAYLARVTEKS